MCQIPEPPFPPHRHSRTCSSPSPGLNYKKRAKKSNVSLFAVNKQGKCYENKRGLLCCHT